MNKDLICAIANPPGVGAVGIIRLSGVGALDLVKKITSKPTPYREACLVSLKDEGELIDTGICKRANETGEFRCKQRHPERLKICPDVPRIAM